MSTGHGPLPAPAAPPKSTLNKKFIEGPLKGFLFQELSRDESVSPSTITLKLHGDRTITVPLSDYREWKEENVET